MNMKFWSRLSLVWSLLIVSGMLFSGFSGVCAGNKALRHLVSAADEEMVETQEEEFLSEDDIDSCILLCRDDFCLRQCFVSCSCQVLRTTENPPVNPSGWMMPFRI